MRVENIPTKLFFYSCPWALWIYSLLTLVVGLPFLVLLLQVHTLVCNRTGQVESICEISHFTAFGASSIKFPLSKLKEARVEVDHIPSTHYKVVLVTDGEILELRSYYDNFDNRGKQKMASLINAFLQDPQQLNLTVKQYPELVLAFLCSAWYIRACLLFYRCQIITCTLDKTLGTVTIKRRSLIGTKVIERSLHQITNVLIREANLSSSPLEPVCLQFLSGEVFSVYTDNDFTNWEKYADKTANLIRKFLDLPSA